MPAQQSSWGGGGGAIAPPAPPPALTTNLHLSSPCTEEQPGLTLVFQLCSYFFGARLTSGLSFQLFS
jgi:hypothetical protein